MIQNKLRLLVMSSVVDAWGDPFVQEMFQKIVALKIAGYRNEYPMGITPLDATDFIGTHLAICEENPDGILKPVVAYRSVTLEACRDHRLVFPPLSILSSSGQDTSKLKALIAAAEKSNTSVSYDSAWTMDPSTRTDRNYSRLLRDVTTTIGVRYHQEFAIPEWVVLGISRFKTNEYFSWMGHSEVSEEFSNFFSFDEKSFMMHLHTYSRESIEVAAKYENLWRDKIVLTPEVLTEREAA